MNIFLRGDKGVGKSTLVDKSIARWSENRTLKIGGFLSFRDENTGIVSVTRPRFPRDYTHAIAVAQSGAGAYSGAFDALAQQYIEDIAQCDLLVFDELGFLEQDAYAFQDAILRCIDSGIPVLGVLKSQPIEWYARILSRRDVRVIDITKNNRDALFYTLPRLL